MEAPNLQEKPNIIDHLEQNRDQIIEYIATIIRCEDMTLPTYVQKKYIIPSIHNQEFKICLTRPTNKTDASYTSYYGRLTPVLYTQKEFLKFGSTILKEKLGQMLPGKINLLFILSDCSVYEASDLSIALSSIALKIRQHDENFFIGKGFDGIQDFIVQSQKFSGILFKNNSVSQGETEYCLWANEQAECIIPAEIIPYLE